MSNTEEPKILPATDREDVDIPKDSFLLSIIRALLIPILFITIFPGCMTAVATLDVTASKVHQPTIADFIFSLFWGISFFPIPFAIGCLTSIITFFYWPWQRNVFSYCLWFDPDN